MQLLKKLSSAVIGAVVLFTPVLAAVTDVDVNISTVAGASILPEDTASLSIALVNALLHTFVTNGSTIGTLMVTLMILGMIAGVFAAITGLFKGLTGMAGAFS